MTERFVIECGFHERDRAAVVALLRAYETGLGISLCFQDFDAEIAGLPGAYAPPGGQLLLLRDGADDSLAGCVAVRSVPEASGLCEMKRLYLQPAARGGGFGRRLAVAAMAEARHLGYRRMCLDTLPNLHAAQALYRSLGFEQLGMSASDPPVLLFARDLETP